MSELKVIFNLYQDNKQYDIGADMSTVYSDGNLTKNEFDEFIQAGCRSIYRRLVDFKIIPCQPKE